MYLNPLDFGAVGDGLTDDTAALQSALDAAGACGGATVTLPRGAYRLCGPISLPPDVTLTGGRRARFSHVVGTTSTVESRPVQASGACLVVDWGAGQATGAAITLHDNSVLEGLSVYWPGQSDLASTPTIFPWAVKFAAGLDAAVVNVQLQNPYQGIWIQDHHRATVHGVTAQAISRGLYIDNSLDVTRISDVHFILLRTPVGSGLDLWTQAHGVAFDVGRVDEALFTGCFCFTYAVGYRFRETVNGKPWASLSQCGADLCGTGLEVQANQVNWPILVSTSMFTSCVRPVVLMGGDARLANCLPIDSAVVPPSQPHPPAVVVLDNGGAGYTETGTWVSYAAGYLNALRYAPPGQAGASASWTVPVSPGTYDIAATWTWDTTHPADAEYRVYDGGTLLGTVLVNQRLMPSGASMGGVPFQVLGRYAINGSSVRVVLTGHATQYAIADAVAIRP